MTIDFKYDETKYVNGYRYIGRFDNLESTQNPKDGICQCEYCNSWNYVY